MAGVVIKISPDDDLYMLWSPQINAPVYYGTYAAIVEELVEYDYTPGEIDSWMGRADVYGTSSYTGLGDFEASGVPYKNQGFLPRANFGSLIKRYDAHDDLNQSLPDVRDLLEG